MDNFQNRIKQAMNLLEKNQKDIVKGANISKGALSNYIHGRYEPKQENVYKIANYLNVNEAWLMGYDDVPMMKITTPNENELSLISNYRRLNDKEKKHY